MIYRVIGTHPQLRGIHADFRTEAERTDLINDITKAGYAAETQDLNEWETFSILILNTETVGDEQASRQEETTARFEQELYDLLKKYQGQDGLTFEVTNSEGQTLQGL